MVAMSTCGAAVASGDCFSFTMHIVAMLLSAPYNCKQIVSYSLSASVYTRRSVRVHYDRVCAVQ